MPRTVLTHLVFNERFSRKVLPHLKADYFGEMHEKALFEIIDEYFNKYGAQPTKEALQLELKQKQGLGERGFRDTKQLIDDLAPEETAYDYLLDKTEKFCKDRAIYNALIKSAAIIEGEDSKNLPDAIPEMLSEALSVGFDEHVGHDYLVDSDQRFDFYHSTEERIKFDIEFFNLITKGGIPKKTLTVILAGTGVGKTLIMAHQAAHNMMNGKNVLYITLEMAEEKIAERIDANLLDVTLDDLVGLDKVSYDRRVNRVRERTAGKLIIKEYPTGAAHVGHFRALLKELKIKKNFKPDIIYIDYINLCASSRIKPGAGANSFTLIKSIAEEFRGLAVENKLPVITATQTTRSGMASSDVDMTDTSESIGLPYTADLMYAAMSSEELEKLGQILIKQLKNRLAGLSKYTRFVVGVDKDKMRLYNLEDGAQNLAKEPGEGPKDMPPSARATKASEDMKNRLKNLR